VSRNEALKLEQDSHPWAVGSAEIRKDAVGRALYGFRFSAKNIYK
jgi:hypothetical protein